MIEGLENVTKADSCRSTKIDCNTAVEEYIKQEDWRIKANANTGYSSAGLVNNLAGKVIANYWLDKVYNKKEGDAHRSGDYHIHDLDILGAYCFTKDTKIKTVEYGDISIEDLLAKEVDEFTVYSTDLENVVEPQIKDSFESLEEKEKDYSEKVKGHFMTCKAKNLRKTRENASLVEIEFEDEVKVRCTPDHKFLVALYEIDDATYAPLRTFRWIEASKLVRKSGVAPLELVRYDNQPIHVKSVKVLEKTQDVYCMEVEDTHCFALENGVIAHNCCGHDLQRLLKEGFNGVTGRVGSHAPKHVREALYQMANFIGILQSEWAGAQAFSSFDTFLSPYVFFDTIYGALSEDDLKKAVRNFVYNLNVPSRWGQSPFSNVTLDLRCPNDLKKQLPMRGDEPMFVSISKEVEKNEKWKQLMDELRKRMGAEADGLDDDTMLYNVNYNLFEPEIKKIAKAYYEVLNEGDAYGVPFTFPIPTINITEDFNWDDPDYEVIWENTAKYGSSYFQNFIGSQYMRDEDGNLTVRDENAYSPNDVRSMAFAPNTRFCIMMDGVRATVTAREMYEAWKSGLKIKGLSEKNEWKDITEVFEIDYSGYDKFVHILVQTSENPVRTEEMLVSIDHKCAVYEDEKIVERLSQDVEVGDWMPFYGDKLGKTKVIATTLVDGHEDKVYNFTINTPEHLVQLANGIVSHQCCRLSLDRKQLRKRGGGLFGADAQTGSIGVVTINMARLGYLYRGKSIKLLIKRLYHLMDLAKSTLEKKRAVIKELNSRGLFPYTARYVRSFDTFFSTIGINGMNECIRNFSEDKNDITDEMGQAMAMMIMEKIRERLLQYQEETGNLYNFEATPGEGCLRADTKVLTIDGPKPIGDLVDQEVSLMSYNHEKDECEFKKGKVFFDSVATKVYRLAFENGYALECTSEHPFAKVEGGDTYWTPASSLIEGDEVFLTTYSGEARKTVKVASVEILDKKMPVFNASVEDNQNFFVGDEEHGYVLTHNTTYRFAKEDLKRFPDIIQAGVPEAPYYTNSSQLPASFGEDVFQALDLQDELQKMYTGGTVLHIYTQEDLTGPQAKDIIRKTLTNYRLPYVSLTTSFSTCPKHGRIPGLHQFCPLCDAEILAKHGNEEV